VWRDATDDVNRATEYYYRYYNVVLSDISVYTGESVRDNTEAALRKALSLLQTSFFKKILVINTSTRQHWALKLGRELDAERIGDEASKPVSVVGLAGGDLCKHLELVAEKVRRNGVGAIIINSWEFASWNTRYKDKLLFMLRELIEATGITVLIYSHETSVYRKQMGRVTRAMGKLSAFAALIAEADPKLQFAAAPVVEAAKPEEVQEEVMAEEIEMKEEEKSEQFVRSDGKLTGWPKFVVSGGPVRREVEYEPVEKEVEEEDLVPA
jgi:hypothetical protein